MVGHGVVFETISTVWTANDATEKEERRGEQYQADRWLRMLGSDDIRELLLDAVLTPKPSDWRRYEAWFGPVGMQATSRAKATKFYAEFARWSPILAPDEIALLEALLDDPEPRVCWSAAMSLAGPTFGSVGEKTAVRLAEAIEDRDWIWSSRQHYEDGSKGCHQAAERVAKLGLAGRVALPAIRRLSLRKNTAAHGNRCSSACATQPGASIWLARPSAILGGSRRPASDLCSPASEN